MAVGKIMVMIMVNNMQGLEKERISYNQQQQEGGMFNMLLHNSGNELQK